jgi:predicted enzyme related to lactoylglutathione lyase
MTIFHGVVFDCADSGTVSAFWKDALGWEYRSNRPEEGWISLQPKGEDNATSIGFGDVPEGKVVKNRVHIDIRPDPGVTWEDEHARLEGLGATTLRMLEDAHYIMADPEGNEFCLLNPRWY